MDEALAGRTDGKPTLDYATPAADGLPASHPEADRLIDARRPPEALRPFLGKGRRAAAYYAKRLSWLGRPEDAPDRCCRCAAAPAPQLAVTTWAVLCRPRTLEIRLGNGDTAVAVRAFPLCHACAERWRDAMARWAWLGWPALLLRSWWIVWVVMAMAGRLTRTTSAGGLWLGVALAYAGLAVFVGVTDGLVLRRLVPPAVRRPWAKRVTYGGLIAILDRDAAGRAADGPDADAAAMP